MTYADLIDELTYRSYRWNRQRRPDIPAEKWQRVFGPAAAILLEARYQKERGAVAA